MLLVLVEHSTHLALIHVMVLEELSDEPLLGLLVVLLELRVHAVRVGVVHVGSGGGLGRFLGYFLGFDVVQVGDLVVVDRVLPILRDNHRTVGVILLLLGSLLGLTLGGLLHLAHQLVPYEVLLPRDVRLPSAHALSFTPSIPGGGRLRSLRFLCSVPLRLQWLVFAVGAGLVSILKLLHFHHNTVSLKVHAHLLTEVLCEGRLHQHNEAEDEELELDLCLFGNVLVAGGILRDLLLENVF
mmetsp:Transcript_12946/g.21904  ORF Transcript_12946/g.21904 Transcript_12946/m.21904 type:complete len:241 (-) Transcript_12946:391-1113(-)